MSVDTDQNQGCLGFFFRLFAGCAPPATQASFPYRVRDDFLSASELSFYHVLLTALNGRAVICPKVGLSDILFVTRPHENRSAYNRIAQKHVDYLVCDPRTLKPLIGVELDDASHARSDRQARDKFVERAFVAAHLPLLRIPAQRSYSLQELSSQLKPYLEPNPLSSLSEPVGTSPHTTQTGLAPLCPKCDVPMVLRTAKQGERSGEQFYGCPNYPKCRQTRSTHEFDHA